MDVDRRTTKSNSFIKWLAIAFLINLLVTLFALVIAHEAGLLSGIVEYALVGFAPVLIIIVVSRKNVAAAWVGALICLPANVLYLLGLVCELYGYCL